MGKNQRDLGQKAFATCLYAATETPSDIAEIVDIAKIGKDATATRGSGKRKVLAPNRTTGGPYVTPEISTPR